MISLYSAADLRARIAMYLHGQAVDSQGRKLLEEAEDALRRTEQWIAYLHRRAEAAESADTFREAENAAGK